MQAAAVGFQCPECATSGSKQQRAADRWRNPGAAQLTMALIAVNVVAYVIDSTGSGLVSRFALFSQGFVPGVGPSGVAEGEWWRIITGGFLHASLLHIGFNMFALYQLGTAMERVVGTAKFGLIYVVSIVGGSVGALAITAPNTPTVGASGGIFGLFAAYAILELSRGMNPMKGGIGPVILLNLVLTFAIPGISIGGHLGGLAAGAAAGALVIGVNRQQAVQRARSSGAMTSVVAGMGVGLFVLAVVVAYIRVG